MQPNKYLKNNNSIAILCENIIKKYNISLAELKYIINNNLNEINRNCLTCNKPLKTINKKNNEYSFIFTEDESNKQIDLRNRIKAGAEQFLLDYFELNNKFNFKYSFINKATKPLIYYNTMCIRDEISTVFSNLSHSIGFNASLQSNIIEFSNFSVVGYLTSPWKAYFMAELKKISIFKYYLFLIVFHNVVFFVFYEYFKIIYRKVRAIIYG